MPPRIVILLEELSAEMVIKCLFFKEFNRKNIALEFQNINIKRSNSHITDRRLASRLRSYKRMIRDGQRVGIVILVDQDRHDCNDLKQRLESIVRGAGLKTKTNPSGGCFSVVNRIVVPELEAWYFGDHQALMDAYPNLRMGSRLRKYSRNPEGIGTDTKEQLYDLLKKNNYHLDGPKQTEIAENVSRCMIPCRNNSRSFQHFYQGMLALADQLR